MSSENLNLFVWHELFTSDVEAGKVFYGAVVGWSTAPFPVPGMNYTMFMSGETPIGGIMALTDAGLPAELPPYWQGTVSVDDCDATMAKGVALGGKVVAPAMDIPSVGRFGILADPTGAVVGVMASSDPAPAIDANSPGRVGWNEMWSSDTAAAWTFYSSLFGWVETGSMEMGPGQVYRMFGRPGDVQPMGGLAAKMPQQPASAWLYYANVASADVAAGRAKERGAHIFMGPMDIPGGGRCAAGVDGQGAAFAVVSHAGG